MILKTEQVSQEMILAKFNSSEIIILRRHNFKFDVTPYQLKRDNHSVGARFPILQWRCTMMRSEFLVRFVPGET